MTTQTFKLSRPLTTHQGEVLSLTLQQPTAGAFVDYGEPFGTAQHWNKNGDPDGVTFVWNNNKNFMNFLVDMIAEKGIDDLILKGLSASDFYVLRDRAARIILGGIGDDKDPT